MNKELTSKLGRWLDCLFGSYSDRIKIIANALVHDWRLLPRLYLLDLNFLTLTEPEIRKNLAGLDESALECVIKYIYWQQTFAVKLENVENFFFNHENYFTPQEKKLRSKMQKIFSRLRKKYVFPSFGPESLIFHHGLPFFPEAAIRYLHGGNFIDAGACYGDSALIFSRFYKPVRIHAFEPSKENREIMQRMMTSLHIPPESYEIIPFGLGKKREHVFFCDREGQSSFGIQENKAGIAVDILPLDDYVQECKLTDIRLVKADLEGMGLTMLQGAEQTIRKNRPLLSLSIYHTREELFEIYRTLRSWDLNYAFTVRSTAFPLGFAEINLLGYPMELNHGPDIWNTDEVAFNKIFELSRLLLKNERYRNRK